MRISDWSSDVCSSDLPLPDGERAGVRGLSVFQRLDDGRQDAIHVFEHLVVPKTDDAVAFGLQPCAPFSVIFALYRLGVLPADQFHHQLALGSGELRNSTAECRVGQAGASTVNVR